MSVQRTASLKENIRTYNSLRPSARSAATLRTVLRRLTAFGPNIIGPLIALLILKDALGLWYGIGAALLLLALFVIVGLSLDASRPAKRLAELERLWWQEILPAALDDLGVEEFESHDTRHERDVIQEYFPRISVAGVRKRKSARKLVALCHGRPFEIEELRIKTSRYSWLQKRALVVFVAEANREAEIVIAQHGSRLPRNYSRRQLRTDRGALPTHRSGDARFDRSFTIQAPSAAAAEDVLTDRRRAALLRAVEKGELSRVWFCRDTEGSLLLFEHPELQRLELGPPLSSSLSLQTLDLIEAQFQRVLAIPQSLGLLPKP